MTARERMVGSSSCGFSVSRISEVCSGGSSSSFEQAVGRLFHERRRGEDGERAPGFDGRAVVGDVNGLAHLAELDQQLRRVGRNDEHVGMGLDEDARLALVGFAQVVAGGDGFGDSVFEVGGVGDAGAVGADAAEVGQAVGFGGVEAVDGLGEHQRQRVFARAARAGQDEEWGKRPERTLSRRCVTVAALPRKSWKPTD